MDNCFDMQCPKCSKSDEIDIYARVWVRITKDGTDADAAAEQGNHEWDEDTRADCASCGHSGKVRDFNVETQKESDLLRNRSVRSLRKPIQEMQKLLAAGDPIEDDNGKPKVDTATCGTCGMSWNDALMTSCTPAPSGRCPYEYEHEAIAELRRRGLDPIGR